MFNLLIPANKLQFDSLSAASDFQMIWQRLKFPILNQTDTAANIECLSILGDIWTEH